MVRLNPVEITATSQTYAVELFKKTCSFFCENASVQPSITGNLQIEDVNVVGNTEYVKVKAQGTITFIPVNGCSCKPCVQLFTEDFTIAFTNVTEEKVPTVDFEFGYTRPDQVSCYGIAKAITAVGLVTVKIPA